MALEHQKIIIDKINSLKKEKNAIVLAHNYVLGEVQDIADFCGDSLELSRKAAKIGSYDVIVFCGVRFMAETAKILSPNKKVLLPVIDAGCPMADMATAEDVRKIKEKFLNAITVCYVNTTAEVKTEVDVCCTSSNAKTIISKLDKNRPIIFLPDKNLGANVGRELNKEMILWDGFCPTHMRITSEMIKKKKAEFPDAIVLVHPECTPEVVSIADKALSTAGIIEYSKQTNAKHIIIGTELGIIHRLEKDNPSKVFIPISEQAVCMNMKKINLEDILDSLENMQHEIILDENTIKKALAPIKKMLELV